MSLRLTVKFWFWEGLFELATCPEHFSLSRGPWIFSSGWFDSLRAVAGDGIKRGCKLMLVVAFQEVSNQLNFAFDCPIYRLKASLF